MHSRMRSLVRHVARVAAAMAAFALMTGCAGTQSPAVGQYAALVAGHRRDPADRVNDQRRVEPADLLAFIGPRPGMVALDVAPRAATPPS